MPTHPNFNRIIEQFPDVQWLGDGSCMVNCNCHPDRKKSVHISEGDDGRILMHDHAGCAIEDILAKIGFTLADLMPPKNSTSSRPKGPRMEFETRYDYRLPDGTLAFFSERHRTASGKSFLQGHYTNDGRRVYKMAGVTRYLYHADEIAAADPTQTVFICEGEKDADRLRALGFLATTNIGGAGKWQEPYSAFLAGRPVVILEDNDTSGSKHTATVATSLVAAGCGNIRVVRFPDTKEKGDISEWLDMGHSVEEFNERVAESPLWSAEEPSDNAGETFGDYTFKDHKIFENYTTRYGPQQRELANFDAEIREVVKIDDGVTVRREILIALKGFGRRCEVLVPESEFAVVQWPIELHVLTNINPIPNAIPKILTAIKLRSTNILERKEFGHIGWRQLDDGQWCYLSASGAITGDGLKPDVAVRLSGPLERYDLPEPPTGNDLIHAVRCLLRLLTIAPPEIALVMFAAYTHALIQDANFSIFLKGRTGSGKTEHAALFQQCLGSAMDAMHLPLSFESTENFIRAVVNRVHEGITVVDDFRRVDGKNNDKIADGIGQGVGNHTGRGRMNADTTLRNEDRAHGTVIMTGEDTPRGESLKARMIILEYQSDSMIFDVLTQCQDEARRGVYAAATAGYIQWLAMDLGGHRATLKAHADDFRAATRRGGIPHARTATSAGALMGGLHVWSAFAVECGAITPEQAHDLKQRTETALRKVIAGQAAELQSSNPVDMFDDALHAVIASGTGHIAAMDNTAPDDPLAWGWRRVKVGDDYDYRAQGPCIGWIGDHGSVHLEWRAAYDLIQKQSIAAGNRLPLTENTLLKRINERGWILTRDESRQTLKTRIQVQGQRHNVVHYDFKRRDEPLISEKPDQPDHSYTNTSFSSDSSEDSDHDPWSGYEKKPDQSSEKPDHAEQKPDQNGAEEKPCPRCGESNWSSRTSWLCLTCQAEMAA